MNAPVTRVLLAPEELEKRIGYCFKNKALLKRALTHRSFGAEHNERLEFLGDSVLNCVIGHALFLRDRHFDEGVLSRVRANLVCEKALDERATLGILGDKMGVYAQKKAADALGDAAKNNNSAAGTFIGMGLGQTMGSAMGGVFSNIQNAEDKPKEKKKFCPECGHAVSSTAKFCPECGSKIASENVCPECGNKVKPTAKFCPECGHKLK